MKKLYFVSLLFILMSCHNQSVVYTSQEKSANNPPKSKMVYLFFEVEKNAKNEEIVKLVDKKEADGFFKNEDFGTARDITKTFYKIILYDKNNQIYKKSIIDNPLSPVLELYQEKGMEKQVAELSKAEFFYRYNDRGNTSRLEIYKFVNNTPTLIFTLKP